MTILRNRRQEAKITTLRLVAISLLFFMLYSILAYRMYHLQIKQHDNYYQLSKHNNKQLITLAPYRADIIDRNNHVIAGYTTKFFMKTQEDLSDEEHQILHKIQLKPQTSLETQITPPQYAYLSNHPSMGIKPYTKTKRYYPYGQALSHLLGYTRAVGNVRFEMPSEDSVYLQGQSGIEARYDKYLQGQLGKKYNTLNSTGSIYNTKIDGNPKRSRPLRLTIDQKLQSYAHDQLFGLTGSVIILNPQSGQILAATSNPSFDNNTITQEIATVSNDPSKPLFNRFLQALYPPASIIKPFIALQALEDNIINPHDTLFDPGYYKVNEDSRPYRNYKRSGHGEVNLKKAISLSNDTYFYSLAHQLGIDKLTDYLDVFKLADRTNIKLAGEAQGVIPNKAYRKKHYKNWFTGQTIISGIGQGDVLVTPISLARAVMLLANGGIDYPLHIVEEYVMPSPKIHHYSQRHYQTVIEAMQEVALTGTARNIGKKPFTLACKTGSAQVARLQDQTTYHSLPRHMKDHHLFIGFAPVDKPSIAIVVIIEHQHEAVNIANNLLDWCWTHGLIT